MMKLSFAPTNRDFVLEKLFSCGVALAIVFMLAPTDVLNTYIVLGQAHFTITYLYQVKAGKFTLRNTLLFYLLAAALFYLAALSPAGITLFAASALIYHVYFSELGILKRKVTPAYLILMAAVMMINGIWLVNALWGTSIDADMFCYFLLGAGFLAGLWHITRKAVVEVEAFFILLLIILLGYIGLQLSGNVPSPYKTYGFIVIAHYMTSYVTVVRRLRANAPQKVPVFITESVLMNLIMLAGYILVQVYPAQIGWVYTVWYMPVSFYVWTLMHFASTARLVPFAGRLRNRLLRTGA